MKKEKIKLFFIFLLVVFCVYVIGTKEARLGLDLSGGVRLMLEAQTTKEIPEITPEVMSSLEFAIQKRLDKIGGGNLEALLQRAGKKRLIIEIPAVDNPAEARSLIGETANLEFKQQGVIKENDVTWESTGLTGKYLKFARVEQTSTGEVVVSLKFNPEGARIFEKVTRDNLHKPLAIFFNGEFDSAPVVQSVITDGNAQINGGGEGFDREEAAKISNLLNAGALPVPAKIIEENSIGPTLGASSIQKSLIAGYIGLAAVMIFMILYYRLQGLVANVALCVYALITYSIFLLIPVTLTLAGIAGFILSIGMAVDANILIFERTKEELKLGRTIFTAIETGFDRAFSSIFDSNITSLISCFILYMLGTGMVKGFASTLAIGILVSMFTAITVTKSFLHTVTGVGHFKHLWLFGIREQDIMKQAIIAETDPLEAKMNLLKPKKRSSVRH